MGCRQSVLAQFGGLAGAVRYYPNHQDTCPLGTQRLLIAASLRGPGQSPVLPFAGCVGSLLQTAAVAGVPCGVEGAPLTWKRHHKGHWPQRPSESSDPTQHPKGRTGDCPGPRKESATSRNVTQGVNPPSTASLP